MPIINRSGGGSASLDYSYAAYASVGALPGSAAENTFGFITSVAITELLIRQDRPTTRADGTALSGGEMWLKSNTNSNRSFNALKSEALQVIFILQSTHYRQIRIFFYNHLERFYSAIGYNLTFLQQPSNYSLRRISI